jgi:hypothetical protein
MRILLSTLVSIGLLAGQAARAEGCARPTERAAFDVAGLKSQLMVTAITCRVEPRYNAFILRFRPDLVRHERTLAAYFDRSYGSRATMEHDDYITALANAQSQSGIRMGTAFCAQSVGLFDEVMALRHGTELPALAASKPLTQPVALVECIAAPSRLRMAEATSKR